VVVSEVFGKTFVGKVNRLMASHKRENKKPSNKDHKKVSMLGIEDLP
jgi:hypothetical protein